jgi:hypothetical protein
MKNMQEEEQKECPLASDEALDALRDRLTEPPHGTAIMAAYCQAAEQFLVACDFTPTPEAVAQLVEAFLPCLAIICERGYDPNGANWRSMGWRGLIFEAKKRLNRLFFNSWKNRTYDPNNAIDLMNYVAYYYRLRNEGSPWGDTEEPG